MLKVLTVIGTRPEAIKMAPVLKQLALIPDQILSRVCVTGQHRQMLDQVLDLFQIKPDYDFNLMQQNQSPTQVAAAVLLQFEPVLRDERPNWVLVHGDTTTAMAAAIGAHYARVRVGHVEAGLRTYDKQQPFPEETNRCIISVVGDLHFAPTQTSRANLLREAIPDERIVVTGNTGIDALQMIARQPYTFEYGPLADIPSERRIIVVTAHRRENLGEPLEQICEALREIALYYRDTVTIIYPVHLNPQVQAPVRRILGGVPGVILLPPLDYLPMVHLMKRSYLVITDSGGLQEEAPGLGKPVLVLRNTTERPEAVEVGTVKLIGSDRQRIFTETSRLLDDKEAYQQMAHAVNPYGDGHAAPRIVTTLLQQEQR